MEDHHDGLYVKCPSQAPVFEYLVPVGSAVLGILDPCRQCCFGMLWSLWDTGPNWQVFAGRGGAFGGYATFDSP